MVMNYWRIYYNLMTSVKYVEYELFPKTMTIFQIWIKQVEMLTNYLKPWFYFKWVYIRNFLHLFQQKLEIVL